MQANRTSPELTNEREKRERNANRYLIKNGLLLWNNRLMVPQQDNLYTLLSREAHDQPSSAHPSIDKTTNVTAPHRGLKKSMMVFALRLEKTKLRGEEEEEAEL